MPLPIDGYPQAAAVSPRLQVTESTGSTNADLIAAAQREELPHLSVLVTTDQRDGRGRLDRTWTTPPGTALAASVLLRVDGLPTPARGWLPLLAGAAMVEAISAQLPERNVALKWPNDVLVNGAKICGILAEAVAGRPDLVVVGAGVNTRMPKADLPVSTAVSFASIRAEADDDRLLADFLTALDREVTALVAGGGDAAASGALARLQVVTATLGSEVSVSLPGGGTLTGRAVRLDADGRLVVDVDGAETTVAAGDVVHVR